MTNWGGKNPGFDLELWTGVAQNPGIHSVWWTGVEEPGINLELWSGALKTWKWRPRRRVHIYVHIKTKKEKGKMRGVRKNKTKTGMTNKAPHLSMASWARRSYSGSVFTSICVNGEVSMLTGKSSAIWSIDHRNVPPTCWLGETTRWKSEGLTADK